MSFVDGNLQQTSMKPWRQCWEFMTFSGNRSFDQSLTLSLPLYLPHTLSQAELFAWNPGQNLRGGVSQEKSGERVLHHNLEKNLELTNVESRLKRNMIEWTIWAATFSFHFFDRSTKPMQFSKLILSGPLPRLLHLSVLHLIQIPLQIWSLLN